MAWNNERNFKSWYEKHYGSAYVDGTEFERTPEMSDSEWAAGQELFRGYNNALNYDKRATSVNDYYNKQGNSLLQRYSSVGANLGENKRIAQQNASITYDKLRKYLPTELKAQGYGDHAATESSMLQADSNYMNAMGNIAAEHAKIMTDVELEKNDTMSQLEKYRRDEITDIDKAKDDALDDAADNALDAYNTSQKSNYDNAMKKINSWTGIDEEELTTYINENYKDVSETQLKELLLEAKDKVRDNKKEKQDYDFERAKEHIKEMTGTNYYTMAHEIEKTYGSVSPDQMKELLSLVERKVLKNIEDEKTKKSDHYSEVEIVIEAYMLEGKPDEALTYLESQKSKLNGGDYNTAKRMIQKELDILNGKKPITSHEGYNTYLTRRVTDYGSDSVEKLKDRIEDMGYSGLDAINIPNGMTICVEVDGEYSTFTYYKGDWYNSR